MSMFSTKPSRSAPKAPQLEVAPPYAEPIPEDLDVSLRKYSDLRERCIQAEIDRDYHRSQSEIWKARAEAEAALLLRVKAERDRLSDFKTEMVVQFKNCNAMLIDIMTRATDFALRSREPEGSRTTRTGHRRSAGPSYHRSSPPRGTYQMNDTTVHQPPGSATPVQGSASPTKNYIEVPFSILISGTKLVVADDDAKGRELGTLATHLRRAARPTPILPGRTTRHHPQGRPPRQQGGRFWGSLPRRSCGSPQERHTRRESRPRPASQPTSRGPDEAPDPSWRQDEDKPRDEDQDGIDRPGDDRAFGSAEDRSAGHGSGVPRSEPGTTQGGGIGMRSSKDVKAEHGTDNPQPPAQVPPNPQRTGDPTTTRTSAGAVAPEVNKPMTAPRSPQASTPPRPVPVPPRRK